MTERCSYDDSNAIQLILEDLLGNWIVQRFTNLKRHLFWQDTLCSELHRTFSTETDMEEKKKSIINKDNVKK